MRKDFETIGVNYYIVDMQNEEDFAKLPSEEVFAIVELAGLLPARMRGYKPKKYIEVNTIGTLNVLEYARRVKVIGLFL